TRSSPSSSNASRERERTRGSSLRFCAFGFYGRFKKLELFRRRIEPHPGADRQRDVVAHVPGGKTREDGDAQVSEVLAEDGLERPHVRAQTFATHELAEEDASKPAKLPGEPELAQHAVDPKRLLLNLFEKEDRSVGP